MKEKRIFIFFIAIAWGILLVPHKAMAVTIPTSGYCGTSDNEEGVMWRYEDGVLTISGNGQMKGYPYYDGYNTPWYPYKDMIRKVVVKKGVTSIGHSAFYHMRYLREVELPEGLERIEGWAFAWCVRLTEITFPSSLVNMQDSAFSESGLARVYIPGSVEMIPYRAMAGLMYACDQLEGILEEEDQYSVVVLEEGIRRLDVNAFDGNHIRTIYLPNSLEQVEVSSISWERVNALYGKNDYMKQMAQKNYAVYVDATQTYDIADVYCKTNLDKNLQSEPKVTLAYAFGEDEVLLNEGIDYSISYEEDGAEGRMMITGMGCYQGTKTIPYVVYRDIASCQVELENTEYRYTEEAIEPEVTVTDQGTVLERGKDYEVCYTNNIDQGIATVSVKGIGGYLGESKQTFRICARDLRESDCTLSQYIYVYDGQQHFPEVVIRDGEKTLTQGSCYTVEYYNNQNVGRAYVAVTGIGNYVGEVKIAFEIIQKETGSEERKDSLNQFEEAKASLEEKNADENHCYEIADLIIQPIADLTYCNRAMEPDLVIMHGEKKLEKDKDYTVTYSDNIDAGTATATVQGIGNYTGVCLVTFVIKPYDVSGLSSMLKGKDGKIYKAEYSGKAICPTTAFRLAAQYNGETIYLYPKESQDYTCEYQKNKKVGTASIEYTFKGNYTGMVVKDFQIIPKAPKLEVTKKTNGKRVIRWKKIKNCDYYEVYRKTSQKGSFKKIAKVKKCYYEDKKAQPDKEYSYKIIACKKQKNKVYRSVSSRKVKK